MYVTSRGGGRVWAHSVFGMSFAVTILVVCLSAVAVIQVGAQGTRVIPPTDDNIEFFSVIQRVLAQGQPVVTGCTRDQRTAIVNCLEVCNAPGETVRNGCCCSTVTGGEGTESGVAQFGVAGGCRYEQRLSNYTNPPQDRIDYKSKPLDTDMPYNNDECRASESGEGECTCVLTWSTKWSVVRSAQPTPSETPIPPTVTPSPKIPSVFPSLSNSPPTPSSSPSLDVATPSASAGTEVSGRPLPPGGSVSASASASASVSAGGDSFPGGSPAMSPSTTAGVEGVEGSVSPGVGDGDGSETEATTEPDDGGGRVCVDEEYLVGRGFKDSDLIHARGEVSATVLCPAGSDGLPCATKHHQVVVNGRAMSYEQLCAAPRQGCTTDTKKVNSVWSHQWTDTQHGEVRVTMYDHRYHAGAQRALHRVMRGWRTMRQAGRV